MIIRHLLQPIFGLLLVSMALASCSHLPTPEQRRLQADTLAATHGWQASQLHTQGFSLRSYGPAPTAQQTHLTIYLEGDGLAWLSRHQPSLDPTPITPTGLQLALAHPTGKAVYLARPCQYQQSLDNTCPQRFWTHARFAAEVLQASLEAIEQLKAGYGAQTLTLVGYSGGGTLAALIAAHREDVTGLITVAAPLDHAEWTTTKALSPLHESLNPADFQQRLSRLPQWHLSGAQDQVVPPLLTRSFLAHYQQPHAAQSREIPNFNHQCCWAQQWPQIWRSIGPIPGQ